MKKILLFLPLFICFSLSISGQKFNRSLTGDFSNPTDIISSYGSTYLLQQPAGIVKFDVLGNELYRKEFVIDSFFYLASGLMKESDSTLLLYGIALDTADPSPYKNVFFSRLDTTLNILDFKILPDSGSMDMEVGFLDDLIYFSRLKNIYVLNTNFEVVVHHENANSQDFNLVSIPLNNDSLLVQRHGTQPFVIVDLSDSTEYDQSSKFTVPLNGDYEIYDYSDSSFCILNNRNTGMDVKLLFYGKDDLSFKHSFNIDSAAGFSVYEIHPFDEGIIGTANSEDFVILSGSYPFNVHADSLKSKLLYKSGNLACDLRNGQVAFAYNVKTCQIHLEVFPLYQRADAFGDLTLEISIKNAHILGNAKPFSGDSLYNYQIEATVDVWVKNNSADFLDSVTIFNNTTASLFSCMSGVHRHFPGINIAPNDSAMVSFTYEFWVRTHDTNVAELEIVAIPIAANGNIVYPAPMDSAQQMFTGMDISENDFSASLSLYPSPARDVLNLEISGGEAVQKVGVYTIDGKLIISRKANNPKLKISTENLDPGIYLIRVQTDEAGYSELFYKE